MTFVQNPNLATTVAWDLKDEIFPALLYIPSALIALKAGYYFYQNGVALSQKMKEMKERCKNFFEKKHNERTSEQCCRIVKETLKASFRPLLFSAITAASTIPACKLLSSSYAATVSLAGACFGADLCVNGKSYGQKIGSTITWIKGCFTPKEEETTKAATFRIAKNILLLTFALGGVATVGAGLDYVISYARDQLSNPNTTITEWNLYELLPNQTPAVVFLEYAALGVLHMSLMLKKMKEKDSLGAGFHAINSALSLIFPTFYYAQATPELMRLHHSFVGLLLAAFPSLTLKTLANFITLDAGLYFFSLQRGRMISASNIASYDFMNLLIDRAQTWIPVFGALLSLETLIGRILPRKVPSSTLTLPV